MDMARLVRHATLSCAALGVLIAGGEGTGTAAQAADEPPSTSLSRTDVDQSREWLWRNPPDGGNRDERRERMAVIQAACDALEPQTYIDYVTALDEDRDDAALVEQQQPALYYLRTAIDEALEDIRRTEVERGAALWLIYNMGYVVKTPDACFAIDISMPKAERLADDLDFLLITHRHRDHQSPRLVDAMIEAGKPVITNWHPGSRLVTEPTELRFGEVRVKVDIGDHHHEQPDRRNDMLMYQVDCGEAAGNCTIYHSGAGNIYEKMVPDRQPDVFIVHVQVGMSVEQAAAHMAPRMTLVSHVMELAHSPKPPNAWRWSYEYAFSRIRNTPVDQATVLTWGERWLTPSTKLREPQP